MLLIGGPLVALFASWAIADVAEYVQELATLRRGRHESHEYTRPARDYPWA